MGLADADVLLHESRLVELGLMVEEPCERLRCAGNVEALEADKPPGLRVVDSGVRQGVDLPLLRDGHEPPPIGRLEQGIEHRSHVIAGTEAGVPAVPGRVALLVVRVGRLVFAVDDGPGSEGVGAFSRHRPGAGHTDVCRLRGRRQVMVREHAVADLRDRDAQSVAGEPAPVAWPIVRGGRLRRWRRAGPFVEETGRRGHVITPPCNAARTAAAAVW